MRRDERVIRFAPFIESQPRLFYFHGSRGRGLILTRRHLLAAGALSGASALIPAAARATILPAQPQIDPALKQRAMDALAAKGNAIAYRDVIGICDFRRASRDARFYLVELNSGMTTSYHCSHGRGSDPTHSGYLERFSNEIGSEATSRGSFVTGEVYYGKYGRSLRLTGLDPDNYNADARAIVVHSARYAEDDQIARFGKLGRSEGCFALSQISLQYVLLKLGPGRLLYSDKA